MRTLFVLCTAVTILQVLDVSITGVSAGEKPDPSITPNGTGDQNVRKVIKTNRSLKTPNPTKATDNASPSDSVDNEPGTNPNDDDSAEAEPPKTLKDSGKRVVKTFRKFATNRGVGLLNGFNGFIKKSDGAFKFFGNFLRDRAMGVQSVARESLGLVSSFSDSSTRGAKHLLNSGRVIGTQAGKEMFSSLQKATKLGTNVTKLGGTVSSAPLSIGEDAVSIGNQVAKVPSRLSKIVTNNAIKPVLSFVVPDSDEEQPEEENEETNEEKKEEKKDESPKGTVEQAPQSPRKPVLKKPAGSS